MTMSIAHRSTRQEDNLARVLGPEIVALMNDPLIHQQAQVWAARLLRETRGEDTDRVRWLFESAYGRLPAPGELTACLESLAEFRQLSARDGGVEPWGDLCHALLNANDFIYVK